MEGGGVQGLFHSSMTTSQSWWMLEDSSGNMWSSGELHVQEG